MPQEAQQFGKYRLLRRIASGGMGEVHLAKLQGPSGFEKLLVIKRLLRERQHEQKFVDMFFSEARVAAQLGHSNIAQVYEVGTIDEVPYIAMEYVQGKSLRKVLDAARDRPTSAGSEHIPVALVVQIVAKLCLGLDFAHDARHSSGAPLGLIHRDINPHNVLISYQGEVKVIDFGIAKSELTWEKTQVGTIKGTVVYMSPEQSLGQKLDRRSDLFSVGIVLYEALAGLNPFHKGTLGASLDAIRQPQPPAISTLRPELVAFVPLLARVLTRTPDQRFPTCGALAQALEALLDSGMVARSKLNLTAYMAELFGQEMLEEERALEATDLASLPLPHPAGSEHATRVSPRPSPAREGPAPEVLAVEAGQSTLVTANPLEEAGADPTRIEVVDLSRREPERRGQASPRAAASRAPKRAGREAPERPGRPEPTQVDDPPVEATDRTTAPEATQLASGTAPPPDDGAAPQTVPAGAEKRAPTSMAPISSAQVTPSPLSIVLRPLQPAWRRTTGVLGARSREFGNRVLAHHPALAGWLVGAHDTLGLRGGRFGLPLLLVGTLALGAGGTALWAARNVRGAGAHLEEEVGVPADATSSVGVLAPGAGELQLGAPTEVPPDAEGTPGDCGALGSGGVTRPAHPVPLGERAGRTTPAPPEPLPPAAARRVPRHAAPTSASAPAAAQSLWVGAEPPLTVRHNGRAETRAFAPRAGGGTLEFGSNPATEPFAVRVRYAGEGENVSYTVEATPWATVYGAGGIELGRTPFTWEHAGSTTTFELRNPHVRVAQRITLRLGGPP